MADKVELDIEINSTQAEKSLANLEKSAAKSTSNMEKAFSGLKTVAVAAIAVFAAKSVFDFFEAGIEGAVAQEQAFARLEAQMEATGENTEAARKQFGDLADELESTTKFGDDAVLSAAALAKSFGISNDEAIKLTKAAADLASATGDSLDGAVGQLTATYSGNIKAVGKLVPELKGLTKEQLAAGEGVTLLAARFAGAANKEIQTYGGAIIQATNSFENFQKSFGSLITQNGAVIAVINGVGNLFQSLQKIVEDNQDAFTDLINLGLKAFVVGISLSVSAVNGLVQVLGVTIAVLADFTAAFIGGLELAASALTAVTGDSAIEDSLRDAKVAATEFGDATIDATAKITPVLEEIQKSVDDFGQGVFDATEKSTKGADKAGKKLAGVGRQAAFAAEETKKLSEESKKFLEGLTAGSATELEKIQLETEKAFDQLDIFVKKNAISEADARKASLAITSIQLQKTNLLVEKGLKETVEKAKAAGEEARNKIQEAANNPIKFFLEKLQIQVEPIQASFDTSSLAAGVSILKNAFKGKEGAEALVGGIAGGIVSAFAGPAVGGAIGEIVSLLAKGDKDSNAKLGEFIAALPDAFLNATESIPEALLIAFESEEFVSRVTTVFLRIVTFAKLWEKAGELLGLSITDNISLESVYNDLTSAVGEAFRAIGKGISDVILEFGRFISELFQNGAQGFINSFREGLTAFALFFFEELPLYIVAAFESVFVFFQDFGTSINEAFGGVFSFFTEELPNSVYNAFKPIFDFFDSLDLGIGEGGSGPDYSKPETLFSKGGIVYAADGFKPRGTDTIPAMLTPGEMVLNRGQQSALFDLANGSGSSGNAEMLQQIIELLSEPITTEVTAEVNGKAIADIVLQQSRQRARLTA